MMTTVRFLHLFSLVVWVGGMIFFSFIAAPSIFKVLPRETAGNVVGEIFPKYWMIGYICSITALVTIIISSLKENSYPWARIILLVLMTALIFYSGLAVGVKARDVKAQIRIIEDQPQKDALKVKFKALHAKSVVLNGIIMILGITVIFLFIYQQRI